MIRSNVKVLGIKGVPMVKGVSRVKEVPKVNGVSRVKGVPRVKGANGGPEWFGWFGGEKQNVSPKETRTHW